MPGGLKLVMDASVLTEDGHTVTVPSDVLPFITLLARGSRIVPGGPGSTHSVPVPLPKIRASTFIKILDWVNLHKEDPVFVETYACKDQQGSGHGNAPQPREKKIKLKLNIPKASEDDASDEENVQEDSDDGPEDEDEDDFLYNEALAINDALMTPADKSFFDSLDLPVLIDVTAAANYLAMEPLLDLCCKTIANMLSGLSVEEIRVKFNIPNDFTPEEEAKLKAQFSWADE